MTRLSEESKKSIQESLPAEIQIAQEDDVAVVENLNESYPDDTVPVLVPKGANRAKFAKVAHEVLAETSVTADWIDFQTDVWEVYRKKYGVVTDG